MPHKIPFAVIHASSTDEGYNMKELEIHNPLVKGWQSSRFCLYPQEIILAFDEKTRIKKLQILAHQFLIATKIEFYVGSLPPDHLTTLHGTRYKRLGYVAMADNAKTGFKARELKSVHVDAVGRYLRLVIHKNHVNKYNLYNQTGIVAINVIGDEINDNGDDPDGTVDPRDINNVINQYMPPGSTFRDNEGKVVDAAVVGAINKPDFISPMDDLAFDMYQDPEVAQIIRKLDTRKNEAVLQEQYDIAKRLKQAIVDLQKVGERLGRYEVEKRRAIETEDYDLAKVKKISMDEYRLKIYKQLELHDLLEMSKSLFWPPHKSNDNATIKEPNAPKDYISPRRNPPSRHDNSPPFLHNASLHRDPVTSSPTQYTPRKASPDPLPPPTVRNANYADDRPLPTLKHAVPYELETGAAPAEPSPRRASPEPAEPSPRQDEDEDAGFGGRKPGEKAEAISENARRESSNAIDIFGEELVAKVYSKNWALREEGMKDLASYLEKVGDGHDKEELRSMLRAATIMAHKCLKDKVFAVFSATVALLRLILDKWIPKHKLTKPDTSHVVDRVLSELIARISDTNPRLKNSSLEFIVAMASFKEVYTLQSVPHFFVVPFKNTVQAKTAIARIEIIERIAQDIGLEKNSGLTVESAMTFANRGIEHTQASVRDAAVNLILELYKMKGPEVRSRLPPEEHPKVQKNRPLYGKLFDGMDKIDGKPTKAERKAKAKSDKTAERKAKQAEIDDLTQQLADLKAASAVAQSGIAPPPKESDETPVRRSVTPNKKRMPRAASIAEASEIGEDIDGQCVFCAEKDESFKEEGLDIHYWKHCPMLKRCGSCKQVVEISAINEHLLTECENKDKFAKCPRCQEAREKTELDQHISDKTCPKAKNGQARCPLCQKTFAQTEENWKQHLMGVDGCEANSRRLASLKKDKGKDGAATKPSGTKKTAGGNGEPHKGTTNKGSKTKKGKTPRGK